MDIEKVINSGLEKVMSAKEWAAKDKLEFIRAVTILLERTQNCDKVSQIPHTTGIKQVQATKSIPQQKEFVAQANPYGNINDNESERIVRNGIVYSSIPDENGVIKYYQITDKIGNQLKQYIEISEEKFFSLK